MAKIIKLSASQAGQLAALSGANAMGYVTPGSREATRLALLNDSAQGIVAAEAAKKAAKEANDKSFLDTVGQVVGIGSGIAGAATGLSSMGSGISDAAKAASSVYGYGQGNPVGPPQTVGGYPTTVPAASVASPAPGASPAQAVASAEAVTTPNAPAIPPTPATPSSPGKAATVLGLGAAAAGGAALAHHARAQDMSSQELYPSLIGGASVGVGPMRKQFSDEDLATNPEKAMQFVQASASANQPIPANVWRTLPPEVKHYVKNTDQYKNVVPSLGDRILWSMPGAARQANGDFYF